MKNYAALTTYPLVFIVITGCDTKIQFSGLEGLAKLIIIFWDATFTISIIVCAFILYKDLKPLTSILLSLIPVIVLSSFIISGYSVIDNLLTFPRLRGSLPFDWFIHFYLNISFYFLVILLILILIFKYGKHYGSNNND